MFCAQSRPKRRLHATKNSVEFLNHSPLLTLVSNSGSDPNYSCFEKGCLTNGEKLTRRYRKLLWVMVVYVCLSEPRGVSAWWTEETAQTPVFMLSPSQLLNRLTPQSSKAYRLPIDIVAYTFTPLWDNLRRNSCILNSNCSSNCCFVIAHGLH